MSKTLKLRISGGEFKNRALIVPETAKPVMEKVRLALFSILSDSIKDANVIDLFAGAGSLGFESLSRGAKSCIFVESDYFAVNSLKNNAMTIFNNKSCEIVKSDASKFIINDYRYYDVIFVDPPYDHTILHIFKYIDRNMSKDSILVYFCKSDSNFDNDLILKTNPELKIIDTRYYSLTKVNIIKLNTIL